MSLDARLSLLWIRLQNRFTASHTLSKEIPRVIESIQPVTNVDSLLQQPRIKTETVSITGAPAYFDFGKLEDMTPVTKNKRHLLVAYALVLGSGVYTFTQLRVQDKVTGLNLAIDNFTSATARYMVFPTPIPMDKDWLFTVTVDAYTSTGNLSLTALVMEEDAY